MNVELLTGSQLAIRLGRPSVAVTRAVARGDIEPDFVAGGIRLFTPARLPELETSLGISRGRQLVK